MNIDPNILRQDYLGDIDRVLSAPILSRFISKEERGRLYGMQTFLQNADVSTLMKLGSCIPVMEKTTMEKKALPLPTLDQLLKFAEQFLADLVTSQQVQQWFATLGPWLTQLILNLLGKSKTKKASAPKTCDEHSCCCCKEALQGVLSCMEGDHQCAMEHFVEAAVSCSCCCDSGCCA